MTRSLILAGGGMKVGYQAGVLQVLLDEAGLTFDHADGTSGGCLNLALFQSDLSGTAIANAWRTTGPFELVSPQPLWRYLVPWRLPALLTFDRMRRRLDEWGVDFERVRHHPVAGTYNVLNFSAKRHEIIPNEAMTAELFPACFSLPIWFPAVTVNDTTYIDGVYYNDANLEEAVRRGADEIWVIWTVSETPEFEANAYNQYFNIIEAIADTRLYEQLAEIEAVNAAVREGRDTTHREITVHVIRHPTPVPLDYLLFYSAGDMARIVDMGVRDARAYLEQAGIPRPGPDGPLAPAIGMRFAEVMRGWWTEGEPDPDAGAKRGRAAGSTLEVHLSITVTDMDRFLAEPAHEAVATGTVVCPALGGRLPIGAGSFNLFVRDGPGAIRELRYRLPFRTADGTPYLLVGVKEVADDAGLDAWTDTTTLFTKVYRGERDEGTPAGAGILTLRLPDLVRQMTTFRVLAGQDPVARSLAILGFGRFFVRELWDTYVAGQ